MITLKIIIGMLLGLIGMLWIMAELEDRPQWKVFLIFLLIWTGGGLFSV